jgi:hypothetical protein
MMTIKVAGDTAVQFKKCYICEMIARISDSRMLNPQPATKNAIIVMTGYSKLSLIDPLNMFLMNC